MSSPPAARACALMAILAAGLLAGCGTGEAPSSGSGAPGYVTAPFSHEQQLVEQGARLVVTDGCSACHLTATTPKLAPNFISFAGHRVKLRDGRTVLVAESFVREGLLHPAANELRGYDPAPMLAAIARAHLRDRPAQVRALAAFIEQVGPET